MTLRIDTVSPRIVNDATGEYMTWTTENREIPTLGFAIHSAEGRTLLVALVEVRREGPAGAAFATKTTAILRKAWVPTDQPDAPRHFVNEHEKLSELPAYLELWNDYGGIKNPHPTFVYADGR